MTSLRSIGVATIAASAIALALTATAVVPVGATSEPPTTDGATTTTAPPPTVPPFTAGPTTSTTTVVTTPGQTTTTVAPSPAAGLLVLPDEPLGPEAMEVVNALYEARVVFVLAQMDPDAAGLDDVLDQNYARSSPARSTVEQYRAELRQYGLRVYLNGALPWELQVDPIVRFYASPLPNAVVRACYIDSVVLYEPGGAPDGSDVIVNDEVYATRVSFTLLPEEGRWQLWSVVEEGEPVAGSTTCDGR